MYATSNVAHIDSVQRLVTEVTGLIQFAVLFTATTHLILRKYGGKICRANAT